MELNMILTITRRSDSEQFVEFFKRYGCPAVLSVVANGTARKSILSMMGLEATEKMVSFTFADPALRRKLMRRLSNEMKIDAPDRGVAVSIPFSSAGRYTAAALTSSVEDASGKDAKEESMESNYDLILAICAGGHTDLVMDAARSAGAAGGTVVHAKGTGAIGVKKFFGLSIADEKEMVFIVTQSNKKTDIMRAIMQNAGADTEAHSLVFSLPVNDTAGFRLMEEEE
ncbi:MAG: P-II family nitrogen regulator [Eubacteriales bacterium]